MNVFVDTNVLVYARDARSLDKQVRAREWMERLWGSRQGRLSFQVLQEYYVVVTQKLDPSLARSEARHEIGLLTAWDPIELDRDVLEAAWLVEDQHRLSWWDALIVAAAHASGCRYLLSEDYSDGREMDGLLVVDPFRHEPGSVIRDAV